MQQPVGLWSRAAGAPLWHSTGLGSLEGNQTEARGSCGSFGDHLDRYLNLDSFGSIQRLGGGFRRKQTSHALPALLLRPSPFSSCCNQRLCDSLLSALCTLCLLPFRNL